MRDQSMPAGRGGAADVVYVLTLLQAAFVALPALGEVALMGGNPLYLPVPLAKVVLLLVLATKVVTGRRWALIGMVALQGVTVFGFWLQFAAGALPWVDFTVNLVVLITNFALPLGMVWMCVALLAWPTRRTREDREDRETPQDPYAPAPLVTTVYPELEVTR